MADGMPGGWGFTPGAVVRPATPDDVPQWPFMVLLSLHRRLFLAQHLLERAPRVRDLRPGWVARAYSIKRETAASLLDRAQHPHDRIYATRKRVRR